ncbi:MAG: hypothetical protein GWN64_17180 [Candidatus Thorarchaeota archaeon]|nr:hypothetical protein [Candidatus Thorarchaeota archaeon]
MDIIKQIKDLMALAKDQAGKPEGELAAEIARRKMDEHAISMEQIVTEGGEDEDLNQVHWDMPKKTTWRQSLLDIICKHCDCEMVYYEGTSEHHIFGYRTNLQVVLYLYEIIEDQLNKKASEYYQNKLSPLVRKDRMSRSQARKSRIDFLITALTALKSRFKKIREQTSKKDPTGFALVSQRANRVTEFFNRVIANVQKDSPIKGNYNPSGYRAGWEVSLAKGGLADGPDSSPVRPKALLTSKRP